MAEELEQDVSAMLEDAVAKIGEGNAPAETSVETPQAETDVAASTEADETAETKADADSTPFTPDDAILERAVKAGLSMEVAKTFASKDAAEAILNALEAKAESADVEDKRKGNDDEMVEVAGVPDIDLSDFTEDNGYDESTVKVLNSMKTVITEQAKRLAALEKAGETARAQDFFTSQFNALDKDVRSHMDAARQSKLKSKFNALEAGYKAQGAKISREDVFKEAVQLAAGDLVSKADAASKTAAAEKRRTLTIARPGSARGTNQQAGVPTEVDVANELFAMLTK